MSTIPYLRRGLAVLAAAVIFAAVLGGYYFLQTPATAPRVNADAGANGLDWPMFGGTVQRNLVNLVEKNVPTEWSIQPGAEKNIKWSIPLGSKAYGGPVVYRGKIFIGTNNNNPRNEEIKGDKGVLMCFQEKDGKFLWQSVNDKLPAGRVNDWPEEGICSSPVAEGNFVYFVNNRCEVVCAHADGFLDGTNKGVQDEKYKGKTDADIIWRLDMIGKLGVFPHNLATCSPLLVGDTLFVITSNGVDEGHINVPAPAAPSFLAVNKKTGEVLWKNNFPSVRLTVPGATLKNLVDKGLVLMHGQWSNPVYAEAEGKPQIIFPGGDGWVYSFNPKTGDLLWKFDCNPKDSVYKLGPEGTRNDFVSTPVVWQNKLYIGVGQDPEHDKGVGHLWCIDITKEPKNTDKDLSPATKPGKSPSDPPLTIFDPKDPANKDSGLVWHYGGPVREDDDKYERNYYFGRTMSTCAIHEGLVYANEYDGVLHCIDALTGKQYWEHDMKADSWSSPYWVDGKVYVGNEKGKMLIFAHGKEKKLLNTIDMKGKIRATPIVVNNTIFLMTENPCKLYAIQAK